MHRFTLLKKIIADAADAAIASEQISRETQTEPYTPSSRIPDGDARQWLQERAKEVKAFWRHGGMSSEIIIDGDESIREGEPSPALGDSVGDEPSDDDDGHEEMMMRRLRRLSLIDDHMQKRAYHGQV